MLYQPQCNGKEINQTLFSTNRQFDNGARSVEKGPVLMFDFIFCGVSQPTTPRYSAVCSSASFPSSLFIAQKEHPLYCGNVISQYCHVLLIIIMIVMIIIGNMSPNHRCDYCDYQLITIYLICKRQGKIARYDV